MIAYVKGKRTEKKTLWALRNISLHVHKGESLGIIGPNGAGKSTLLKVVSGVIKPARGEVHTNGAISPLIELSAGFDDELTGEENIYLNASILGFSRKEIEERYERIVDFSELRDFIGTPLKNYSSGMVARLAFSVATEADPDILIIDEVLAVGDARFRQKSKERILAFKDRGIAILFVSHDLEQVEDVCNKVLWLDHGAIERYGDTHEIILEYIERQTTVKRTD
jgi:ABC-type polysaccharide/polyol phosphate transport system ATPase subunit